jgi:protease I
MNQPDTPLAGRRIALLVAPMYRDEEVFEPLAVLRGRGASVTVLGLDGAAVPGKLGGTIEPDGRIVDARPDDFDAVIIPGGQAPERLRLDAATLAFVREFARRGSPIAAICHGPQVLISADLLRGRRATCYEGIRDDVKLAGARYEDAPVVIDGNLITSRTPDDLPPFHDAITAALAASPRP